MRVLIAGAAPHDGHDDFYRERLHEADAVVAADGGGEWAVALGRVPDVVVGDFDSAVPGAQARLRDLGAQVREAPARKDASDLDLAVAVARDIGATDVAFTAAFSARLDHTLAALGTLTRAADLHAEAHEPDLAAWALAAPVRTSLQLLGRPGTTLSVFALDEASGVTLHGFEYPLTEAVLTPLSSLGLSNVTASEQVSIEVAHGTLLVLANVEPGHPRPSAVLRGAVY